MHSSETWIVGALDGTGFTGIFNYESEARASAAEKAEKTGRLHFIARVMAVVERTEIKTYRTVWSLR